MNGGRPSASAAIGGAIARGEPPVRAGTRSSRSSPVAAREQSASVAVVAGRERLHGLAGRDLDAACAQRGEQRGA